MSKQVSIRQIANGWIVMGDGSEQYVREFSEVLDTVAQNFREKVYQPPRITIMEWYDVRYSRPIENGEVHILQRRGMDEERQGKINYKGEFKDDGRWITTHWSPVEMK